MCPVRRPGPTGHLPFPQNLRVPAPISYALVDPLLLVATGHHRVRDRTAVRRPQGVDAVRREKCSDPSFTRHHPYATTPFPERYSRAVGRETRKTVNARFDRQRCRLTGSINPDKAQRFVRGQQGERSTVVRHSKGSGVLQHWHRISGQAEPGTIERRRPERPVTAEHEMIARRQRYAAARHCRSGSSARCPRVPRSVSHRRGGRSLHT